MSRRKGKQIIQFSNRTHPRLGVISMIMGAAALILLSVLCLISGASKGQSGAWIGIAGFWLLVLSIVGFVFSIKSYRLDDIYMVTPTLGSVFNGIVLVVMMLLYVEGTL
ncbi:MAG: hypothetical protein J6P16_05330 [Eubacterium sp.]|nr:hypothetical protein [Eubacterium sp.]